MEILGLQIEGKHVGQQGGEDRGNIPDGIFPEVSRRGERRFSAIADVFAGIFIHGRPPFSVPNMPPGWVYA
jgi:hypothetical protein